MLSPCQSIGFKDLLSYILVLKFSDWNCCNNRCTATFPLAQKEKHAILSGFHFDPFDLLICLWASYGTFGCHIIQRLGVYKILLKRAMDTAASTVSRHGCLFVLMGTLALCREVPATCISSPFSFEQRSHYFA